jgi:hypothetical protein
LVLGAVLGVDRDDAGAAPVRGHHHPTGLFLAHAEFRLQHRDDELARRIVVVDQYHLVQPRPFGLQPDLGAWLRSDVPHRRSQLRLTVKPHRRELNFPGRAPGPFAFGEQGPNLVL